MTTPAMQQMGVLTDESGEKPAAIEAVKRTDGAHYIAGCGGPGGGIWVTNLIWRQ